MSPRNFSISRTLASISVAFGASAQNAYDSSNELLLYQSQYQESMERPIQKDRSRRAWIGTGIGFALNLVVIYAVLASY